MKRKSKNPWQTWDKQKDREFCASVGVSASEYRELDRITASEHMRNMAVAVRRKKRRESTE